jgi:hypothetical protein
MILDCVGCGRPVRATLSFPSTLPLATVIVIVVVIDDAFVVLVQMASNRYASHLSGCIGTGTGTRRAAVRNATSKSKYELLSFCFWHHSNRALMVLRTGAGSGQMRDAPFHRTQARRTETCLITTPLLPRRDRKKRVDRQRISLEVGQVSFVLLRIEGLSRRCLSAPVQAASNAAGVINDEDALSNRKRVGWFFLVTSIEDHRLIRKWCRSPVLRYPHRRKIRNRKCRVR